jgi:hypothetical protein
MSHRIDDVAPADSPVTFLPSDDDMPHRQAVADALAAWIDASISRGRPDVPATRLRAVERIARQVDDLLTAERRRAALFAMGAGQSAAAIGDELGLSRWAVAKRWPDLKDQARPLRWLSTNQTDWSQSLYDLLEFEEPAAHLLPDEQRQALARLREIVDVYRTRIWDWALLVDTPNLVRTVLAGPPPPQDTELRHHVVRDWLYAQLADYDLTSIGEKTSARTEVSRAAVHAATRERLGRRD